MKLSNELYNSGILGHQNTQPTDWKFEQVDAPRGVAASPIIGAIERRQQSIKVSPRGLRLLAHVLRVH